MLSQSLMVVMLASSVAAQGLEGAPIPCEGECPTVTFKHYEARGCEPIFDDSVSECCPVGFNCSAPVRDPTKCYYKGKSFSEGEAMQIDNPCERHCICDTHGKWPSARCAQVECPSLFNPRVFQCRQTHTVDSCCPELSDCPAGVFGDEPDSVPTTESPTTEENPAVVRASATCTVNGKDFEIGEKMYPDVDHCQVCVCSENFTDIYGVGCRTIDCGMQHRDRQELEEGCTPIYFNKKCCQIDWLCPGSPKIGKQPETATEESDPITHCTLGSTVLPLNATLVTVPEELNCFCATPPDFTCIQYPTGRDAKTAFEAGVRTP